MRNTANQEKCSVTTRHDPRWQTVVSRDSTADGTFYYSVTTTGVYCRPSCPSRVPRPENVRFHASWADAEKAGFRPCKRCTPHQPGLQERYAEKVEAACRLIENSDHVPGLKELSNHAGLSRYHFHRVFKAVTGLTPKGYTAAHLAKRVRSHLNHKGTVTEAIYEAGFNSNGRFYETSDAVLGMTPSSYRAGGSGIDIRFAVGECSLGSILVATSERGVCAILLGDDPEQLTRDLQKQFPQAHFIEGDVDFGYLVATVIGFVEAPERGLDLPLDVQGTAFQQRVWKALQNIPAGSTVSYADLAASIGAPKAIRAVARACGTNAIAVAIPCHRVVRTNGELSGYRWGIERKRVLLERESHT
ncbi:bifunctional DNA-binding transcriptional regulator/O6-methylguanine-DNA methyltransferase Ada [Nitrospira sp. T9]|uniref:bifunctional DNA-binding transcriptional regulator/O6-methylguanine-DNA methyltransferase Ada n=1 Tax=unclassified Nitrospira TaxID=2652172 RepID=UPI003F9B2C12